MYCTLIILSLMALVMGRDSQKLTARTRNCVDIRFSLFLKANTWPTRPEPPQCGNYECFNEFPTECQRTCENIQGNKNCEVVSHQARCECLPGFVRNMGLCIDPSKCPIIISRTKETTVAVSTLPLPQNVDPPVETTNVIPEPELTTETPVKCGLHESWDKCGGGCPATCKERKHPATCNRMCLPGCSCDEGYFQHKSGKCVSLKLCDMEEIHEKFWKTFMELIIETV